jgi:hypothetical protein
MSCLFLIQQLGHIWRSLAIRTVQIGREFISPWATGVTPVLPPAAIHASAEQQLMSSFTRDRFEPHLGRGV